MKPMVEVSGVVHAPPDEVVDRVYARFAGETGPYRPRVEVDRERRMVALQGGWWYRGEYTVDDHPAGTLVTHRVFNVARRARWSVPLANRLFIGFRAKVVAGFTALLDDLG
ncbi:hypothetical protein SAMN05421504_104612 [Amycolatopsis xylanica]|uniref:Polyketide cyclase / dehydrase and lipid transport n=1 Tax=Amycolatopsis xylanica TaxID=589385 RepID=A0A1H3HCS5_9PSEU|nr:hypothetical protein [Amycolatopsis xylanica]SDY13262.1 hypothetical protein SAMN05421504_104612 [Amycolatopsis xylanica]